MLGCTFSVAAYAFEPFVVEDIRLEGLQRISVGTVLNYLPINVGDQVDEVLSANAIRALYQTGFFKDVRLDRENNTLVVFVAERPAIAGIAISGNQDIPTEQLQDALGQIGLAEGRVFDRALLDRMELELQRQYYSLGKYAVSIDSEVTPLERNRVDIAIRIAEGDAARIRQFNIVGNQAFGDEELLGMLQLARVGFFTGRQKYARQLLAADLETLRTHYLDNGYINFNINSSQVSLTPDRQDVYITVNVTEGEQYTVSDLKLAGDLIVEEAELRKLIAVRAGDLFSRTQATDSSRRISDRLGEEGYAFANINMIPDIDQDRREVALTFFVDPGRRVYVRRINITGNTTTRDEVIRRELRQFEGTWMSTERVARSRTRLDRLGFFEQVNVETPVVPGNPDQVDINYTVTERPTGSLSAGVGYSDSQGVLLNFSVTQENFLGTGKRVAVNVDNSSVTQLYSVNYTNPYYTLDGVSRGFSVYSRRVDAGEADITNYTTNSFGGSITYGIPMSEHNTLRLGIGYENTELVAGTGVASSIEEFIATHGSRYDTYRFTGSLSHDTRNRAIFPDRGSLARISTEVAVPGGSLQFYKLSYRHQKFLPFWWENWALALMGDVSYGDGYGDTADLPPFENYYAGGSRSVRGYAANALGPKDPDTNDPLGGNARILGNFELIFPNPFAKNSQSVRLSAFADAGYVYNTKEESVDLGELRYSAGLSAIWLTPVGALRFSLAEPLNAREGDRTERFQFSLGTAF